MSNYTALPALKVAYPKRKYLDQHILLALLLWAREHANKSIPKADELATAFEHIGTQEKRRFPGRDAFKYVKAICRKAPNTFIVESTDTAPDWVKLSPMSPLFDRQDAINDDSYLRDQHWLKHVVDELESEYPDDATQLRRLFPPVPENEYNDNDVDSIIDTEASIWEAYMTSCLEGVPEDQAVEQAAQAAETAYEEATDRHATEIISSSSDDEYGAWELPLASGHQVPHVPTKRLRNMHDDDEEDSSHQSPHQRPKISQLDKGKGRRRSVPSQETRPERNEQLDPVTASSDAGEVRLNSL